MQLASERFEEGERALREARQVEAEHQTRLRNIHAQIERLRQQEHNLQQVTANHCLKLTHNVLFINVIIDVTVM